MFVAAELPQQTQHHANLNKRSGRDKNSPICRPGFQTQQKQQDVGLPESRKSDCELSRFQQFLATCRQQNIERVNAELLYNKMEMTKLSCKVRKQMAGCARSALDTNT